MRRLLGFALKAGISIALLYFAISGVNLSTIGDRLRGIKAEWFAGAVALGLVQYVLLSVRWRQISSKCGAPLTFGNALRLNLIGAFFNQVLPSAVGGDAIRIWLLGRSGAGLASSAYSVLLDRFVGVLALAITVIACLPWTMALIQNPVGRLALLVIGAGSVGGAVAFLSLGYLPWRWSQRWASVRHLTQMSRAAASILRDARTGGAVLALSLIIQCLTAAMACFAAYAIDAPLEFFPALQLIPPVMLITTIPISVAGWGVREKSLVVTFGYAGMAAGDGFLVSVLMGLTTLAVGIIGGIVWLVGSDRIASASKLAGASNPSVVDVRR